MKLISIDCFFFSFSLSLLTIQTFIAVTLSIMNFNFTQILNRFLSRDITIFQLELVYDNSTNEMRFYYLLKHKLSCSKYLHTSIFIFISVNIWLNIYFITLYRGNNRLKTLITEINKNDCQQLPNLERNNKNTEVILIKFIGLVYLDV